MKITVNGAEYDIVQLDTIDLDESCWFFDIAGVGPEVLEDMEDFNPKAIKALLCLSVARAEPTVRHKEIEAAIGAIKIPELGEMFEKAKKDQEASENPPVLDPAPETESEQPSSGDASSSAGDTSPDESGQSDSGTQGLDTGSASVRVISAA